MRNVLLIVVDCLRADRVIGPRSCRTPVLDQLGSSAAVYAQAIASTPVTTPSFATLLTGCYPPRHGVRALRGYKLGSLPTLGEMLKARGFRAHAEVTGPLLPQVGLDRGFDEYVFRETTHDAGHWWRGIGDRLRALPSPWFALIHVWDLHRPRQVHPECDTRAYGRTRYDRAMSSLDRELEGLLDAAAPDDVVVLTGRRSSGIAGTLFSPTTRAGSSRHGAARGPSRGRTRGWCAPPTWGTGSTSSTS